MGRSVGVGAWDSHRRRVLLASATRARQGVRFSRQRKLLGTGRGTCGRSSLRVCRIARVPHTGLPAVADAAVRHARRSTAGVGGAARGNVVGNDCCLGCRLPGMEAIRRTNRPDLGAAHCAVSRRNRDEHPGAQRGVVLPLDDRAVVLLVGRGSIPIARADVDVCRVGGNCRRPGDVDPSQLAAVLAVGNCRQPRPRSTPPQARRNRRRDARGLRHHDAAVVDSQRASARQFRRHHDSSRRESVRRGSIPARRARATCLSCRL